MRSRAGVAAILACAAIAGCGQSDRDQASRAADDALVVAQVHAKAAAIDPATMSLIGATDENGTVTLTGKVANVRERTAIEAAARGVNGVRGVVDRIVIDPSAPTGAEIEADLGLATEVHAALAAQTGVNAAAIHVDVYRGVVTLSGTLPTRAHREVADETVRSLHGVKRLIDDIQVAAPQPR
jgi:osmotically-inducible protein OsmY